MVLIKPHSKYNSGSPADAAINRFVDKLSGKLTKQKAEQRKWDQRVTDIERVLGDFPALQTDSGYYPGWQGDYTFCVTKTVLKPGTTGGEYDLNSGNYGLSPRTANALPPTDVVDSCLIQIKQKYEQRQRNQTARERAAACGTTPAAKIAQLANGIALTRALIQSAQARIDKDKEVEEVSGTIDLDLRHQMGEIIVNGRQAIKTDFSEYRQLGGKAATPNEVVAVSDPCEAPH